MADRKNRDGKGLHPLYIWAIVYVALTYIYPVLIYRDLTQGAGEDIPLEFWPVPFVLLIINVIVVICSKGVHRRVILNCAQIIKYLLIPFFVAGGLLCGILFLLIFTPVVIMAFVSPLLIAVLCVMGYASLIGSSVFVIAYLSRSVKDGKKGKAFSLVIGIMQFFFVADVIGTIVSAVKEYNDRKNYGSSES